MYAKVNFGVINDMILANASRTDTAYFPRNLTTTPNTTSLLFHLLLFLSLSPSLLYSLIS